MKFCLNGWEGGWVGSSHSTCFVTSQWNRTCHLWNSCNAEFWQLRPIFKAVSCHTSCPKISISVYVALFQLCTGTFLQSEYFKAFTDPLSIGMWLPRAHSLNCSCTRNIYLWILKSVACYFKTATNGWPYQRFRTFKSKYIELRTVLDKWYFVVNVVFDLEIGGQEVDDPADCSGSCEKILRFSASGV